jgi:hypothetical protein
MTIGRAVVAVTIEPEITQIGGEGPIRINAHADPPYSPALISPVLTSPALTSPALTSPALTL